ncbi:MAG: tRNA (5-methylaminomethyl-2-thiouridine)(34)-methyltransferase MnmD [Tenacibaculum sp.]
MQREIIITSDGSTSVYLPEWNEYYHSKHGAIKEAYHVFIRNGLEKLQKNAISILELGFGTGLNCFITFLESKNKINYTGVDAYPLSAHELSKLNYISELKAEKHTAIFNKLHELSWGKKHSITHNFFLTKQLKFFKDITDVSCYDLIYFDAFGARVQPELWTEEIFFKMFKALNANGFLVTYAAKGSVRRAMQAVGFLVKKLPGPPGKREMLRAIKPSN